MKESIWVSSANICIDMYVYVCIRMHVNKKCTRESQYCAPTYISYLLISQAIVIILSIALALGVIGFLAAGMLILGVMRVRFSTNIHI